MTSEHEKAARRAGHRPAGNPLSDLDRQWQATFDAMNDAICIVDLNGHILRSNRAMAELLSCRAEDLAGRLCFSVMHNDTHPIPGCPVQRMRESRRRESMVLEVNGRWYDVIADPIFDATGELAGAVHILVDTSERRQVLAQLQFQARALSQVSDAVLAADQTGRVTYWSAAAERLYQLRADEVLGRPLAKVVAFPQPPSDEMRQIEASLAAKGFWRGEWTHTRRDGGALLLEISCSVLRDESGTDSGRLVVVRDITERRRAETELEHLRTQLAHIARHATVGELTTSLAHELNQPLTAILNNAQAAHHLLAADPPNLPELRSILEDIVADDLRASDVIRRLRGLLKKDRSERRPVNLNRLASAVATLIRNEARQRHVLIALDLAPDVPPVYGDPIQLQQVMLNLTANAMDAMVNVPIALRKLELRTAVVPGNQALVSVRDHGTGIPEAQLNTVFDAFFTTKREGMGLGLPICRSIIRDHEGRIWAENHPDGGAVLHITLPACEHGTA